MLDGDRIKEGYDKSLWWAHDNRSRMLDQVLVRLFRYSYHPTWMIWINLSQSSPAWALHMVNIPSMTYQLKVIFSGYSVY